MNKQQLTYEISIKDQRIIETITGEEDGPCIILLAGVHGNEYRGVEAVEAVIHEVQNANTRFKGSLYGIRGNLNALEKGGRFVDEDMNRLWYPAIIEQIEQTPQKELKSSERKEVKQLLRLLESIIADSDSPTILADLHSFSADGAMFSITNHNERQVELVSKLYSPMVFGIEDTLRGTVLNYYQHKDLLSFGLEGGQHNKESTKYNLMASIFVLLYATGCLDADEIPNYGAYQKHLKTITKNLPVSTELVYQHIIKPGDNFVMRPGYKNFQRIEKGEWLATDKEGKIEAEVDGYMLMPLYQKQGDDGFFIIRSRDS